MSVVLTEKAATEVKRYQGKNKVEDEMFLRVAVAAAGCSGYSYKLEFDQEFIESQDDEFAFHGVRVVVDKKSSLLLDGTTIVHVTGADKEVVLTAAREAVASSTGCARASPSSTKRLVSSPTRCRKWRASNRPLRLC